MIESVIKISATDGVQLIAIHRTCSNFRKGIVQINCGAGVPQLLYANFAKYLSINGYDTITYDYRGVGLSAPKSLKNFNARLRDWGKLDMTGVFDWVIKKYPNDRKIIIGHSMGGQLIGMMNNTDKVDQIILIAVCTGYWKDMNFPYRLKLIPLWFLFVPLTVKAIGYTNAKKIRHGENLPKGVAIEWRDWSVNPNYFEDEFNRSLKPVFYHKIKAPIKSIQITDDPIANTTTANKILKYFCNSDISIEVISPNDLNVDKIGHSGFFSRKFKKNLWKKMIEEMIFNDKMKIE